MCAMAPFNGHMCEFFWQLFLVLPGHSDFIVKFPLNLNSLEFAPIDTKATVGLSTLPSGKHM